MRLGVRGLVTVVVMGLLSLVAGQGVATAALARTGFMAQAREAGLSAGQTTALQAKVDDYLVKLAGRGTQVSPNQIDMNGAVLNITVPGEDRPRQLVRATKAEYQAAVCKDWSTTNNPVPYGWFCAYEYQWGSGDSIGMYACGNYLTPWYTTGSWLNNQTTGTVPRLYFTVASGRPPWDMPAARSMQGYHVDWSPVHSITNCR